MHFLPLRDGVVVYILCNFGDHDGAEFVLYVAEHLAGIEGLIRRVGLIKRLLGVDIIGEMYHHGDGQFALRCIAIRGDSALRDVVSGDLSFEFQIAPFVEDLQSCLPLEKVTDAFRQFVAQVRVHHRGIVREVCDRDRVRGLVVDIGTVELITDRTTGEREKYQTADTYVSNPSHTP